MSELPRNQQEFIAFCQAHADLWADNAAALGVLPQTAALFKTHADAAKATLTDADSARVASKAATQANDIAMRIARSDAADIIKTIRAFAATTNNPTVYAVAGISPPSPPTPAPKPAKPERLQTILEPTGALTLAWSASNPRGGTVTYAIRRKLPGQAAFSLIATTGGNAAANGRPTGRRGLKQWTDETLPTNSGGVQYIITGTRGNIVGDPSEILTVVFGTGNSGAFIASATTSPSTGVQLAA